MTDLKKVQKELCEIANSYYPNSVDCSCNNFNDLKIVIGVEGDWKHTHLSLESKVEDYCKKISNCVLTHTKKVVPSDCDYYTATHTFKIHIRTNQEIFYEENRYFYERGFANYILQTEKAYLEDATDKEIISCFKDYMFNYKNIIVDMRNPLWKEVLKKAMSMINKGVYLPLAVSNIRKVEDLGYVDPNDSLEEVISDYLSDTYGYCHKGFKYTDNGDTIRVYEIIWDEDLEEE